VPTYRVYYAERDPTTPGPPSHYARRSSAFGGTDTAAFSETEWEEEVEAKDAVAALEAFFRDHARNRSDVMWLDEDGQSRQIEGVSDYDPDKTYIWIEDDKLMEYQGIDEATPGMVTCPLCDGQGEVDEETADEFLAAYGAESGDFQ
jgi:hypothetical protein